MTENAAPVQQADRETRLREAQARSKELASQDRILDRLADDLRRSGMAGDVRSAKLLYLILTTRCLEQPVSAVIKGPSSGGKSYLALKLLRLFPKSAYHYFTSMSERALAYGDEPLAHKFIVVAEASGLAGGVGASLMRSLLSEGLVRYETVEAVEGIGLRPRVITREGPTGLLVTTTALRLDRELETRLFSIQIDDSREQTAVIMLAQAGADHPVNDLDFDQWRALQEAIELSSARVIVPFAETLARTIPPVSVRLRRDFLAVLSLVKAHALLHQAIRESDADGRIVAILDDYAAVHELVAELLAEGVEASIPKTVRDTVEQVAKLMSQFNSGVPLKPLAEALGLDKSSASRRVQKAIDGGFLRNSETVLGRPMGLLIRDQLPEEQAILPPPDALRRQLGEQDPAPD